MVVQYTWFALSLCFIASFADIIGGSLTVLKKLTPRQFTHVTALGAGFLLGATLLDRLPDSMHELPTSAPIYIVAGYLVVLAMEVLQKRTSEQTGLIALGNQLPNLAHAHEHVHGQMTKSNDVAALVALLVHTFMDGVIIAGAFTMNRAAGILMFVAITMHKLPEGFTMATISLAATNSRRHAFLSATWLACSTMAGAGVTLLFGSLNLLLLKILMALATGTFLFIATSSLVPIVRGANDKSSVLTVAAGVAIFYGSLILIHHAGLT